MAIVTVFCGSSHGNDKKIISDIKNIGTELAKHKSHVLYGGGLYGHLQDLMTSVGEYGGTMDAILSPAYYDEREIYPPHVTVVKATDDEDRIRKFLNSDAFIVTPGGDGTLAESFFAHNRNLSACFSEATKKPVVFLNTNNFYYNLINHFQHMIEKGYSNKGRQDNLYFEATSSDVIKRALKI